MKFTKSDNQVLTEIERRIRYFNDNNMDSDLLILLFPSEAKSLKNKGYIKPYNKEIKRANNWYNLTSLGKELLSKINQSKINGKLNQLMFNKEITRNFNKL